MTSTKPTQPHQFGARADSRQRSSPDPEEARTLLALFAAGRNAEAAALAKTMTENFPGQGLGWKALGVALMLLGRSAEALVPMQEAAALLPNDAETHCNLGVILINLERFSEAADSCRRALLLRPNFAVAHSNLGNALRDLGQLGDAVASYRRAVQINPHYAEAHSNLGNVLRDIGQYGDAAASCRQAVQINPNYAEAFNNLGNALRDLGQMDAAAESYRRAMEIRPNFVVALNNFAFLCHARGQSVMALNAIRQSLQIEETVEAKGIFAACVKRLRIPRDDTWIREALVRALTEAWGRPGDLARIGIELIRCDTDMEGCIARAAATWPLRLSGQELFGPNGLPALAANPLLCALLDSTPICDIDMERFLTMARQTLLAAATGASAFVDDADTALIFYCGVARQCFINEYVYSYTEEEIRTASELRDSLALAIEAKAPLPAFMLVAVAAYFPLFRIALVNRLLDIQWPASVQALLVQQVREPEEDLDQRNSIPRLTSIEDEVSLLVQDQYEESPYPRWINTATAGKTVSVVEYLRQRFPLASFTRHCVGDRVDVLIAGCGTGQHSIQVAQQFRGAKVLAVDLSISSLCYAKRKTRELRLTSIDYAQADLMKLGTIDRSFDVIESVGVLHHLADPWAGWKVLLSLLRPGGFMALGFYSEVGRRDIVRARDFIAAQGYGATANDIRRCRQALMNLENGLEFGTTLKQLDFFSSSACRDLLFHVQEHRMTLGGIDAFLHDNGLVFLGFEIDPQVLNSYKLRFPDDPACTSLCQWQIYENENPDTFLGMYQFWIQKPG